MIANIEITESWNHFRRRFSVELAEVVVRTGAMLPEKAALMFFIARNAPDNAELFPRGKWAMIQHLEEAIELEMPHVFADDLEPRREYPPP